MSRDTSTHIGETRAEWWKRNNVSNIANVGFNAIDALSVWESPDEQTIDQIEFTIGPLVVIYSGGLTTGPLGPGPQAPELQGPPNSQKKIF